MAGSGFFTFHTTKGDIQFNLVDVTGKEKAGVRHNDSYSGAKGAIIMWGHTARVTSKNVPKWIRDLEGSCGREISKVICVDNPDDIGDEELITGYIQKKNLPVRISLLIL